MDIRILPETCYSGYMQMALDEAILLNGIPTLRFYTWQEPCISLGYFQKSAEINLEYLQSHDIGLVRRPTGGKAVYHQQDLTYSIVLPTDFFYTDFFCTDSLQHGISASYRKLAAALLAGVSRLGLAAEYNDRPGRSGSAPNCFQSAGWFEIYVAGRKLAGSAQVRKKGVLLQQGSILIDIDFDTLSNCFRNSAAADAAGYMTCLNRELPQAADSRRVAEALELGFRQTLACQWHEGTLSGQEKQLAADLCRTKYSSREWNFSR